MAKSDVTFTISADGAKAVQELVKLATQFDQTGERARAAGDKTRQAGKESSEAWGGAATSVKGLVGDFAGMAAGFVSLQAAGSMAMQEIRREMERTREGAKALHDEIRAATALGPGNARLTADVRGAIGGPSPGGVLTSEERFAVAQAYRDATRGAGFSADVAAGVVGQASRVAGLVPDTTGFARTMGNAVQLTQGAGMQLAPEDLADLALRMEQENLELGGMMQPLQVLAGTPGVGLDNALRLAVAAQRTNQGPEPLNAIAKAMVQEGPIAGPQGRFFASNPEARLEMLLAGEGPLEAGQVPRLGKVAGEFRAVGSVLDGVLSRDLIAEQEADGLARGTLTRDRARRMQAVRAENVMLERAEGDFREQLALDEMDIAMTDRHPLLREKLAPVAAQALQVAGATPERAAALPVGFQVPIPFLRGPINPRRARQAIEEFEGVGMDAGTVVGPGAAGTGQTGAEVRGGMTATQIMDRALAKLDSIDRNTRRTADGPVLGSAAP